MNHSAPCCETDSTLEARSTDPGSERPGHALDAPVVAVDLEAEDRKLQADPVWSRTTQVAKTLLKQKRLRVVLTVMGAGARLAEHHTAAAITIQPLRGRLEVRLPGETLVVGAGQLVALDQGILHGVEALEDSSFLLTLAWPETAAAARSAEDGR